MFEGEGWNPCVVLPEPPRPSPQSPCGRGAFRTWDKNRKTGSPAWCAGPPGGSPQSGHFRSKRSSSITLCQAAAKSLTNFSWPSSLA